MCCLTCFGFIDIFLFLQNTSFRVLVRPVLSLIQGSQWTYLSPIHVLWDQLTLMLSTERARWRISDFTLYFSYRLNVRSKSWLGG